MNPGRVEGHLDAQSWRNDARAGLAEPEPTPTLATATSRSAAGPLSKPAVLDGSPPSSRGLKFW